VLGFSGKRRRVRYTLGVTFANSRKSRWGHPHFLPEHRGETGARPPRLPSKLPDRHRAPSPPDLVDGTEDGHRRGTDASRLSEAPAHPAFSLSNARDRRVRLLASIHQLLDHGPGHDTGQIRVTTGESLEWGAQKSEGAGRLEDDPENHRFPWGGLDHVGIKKESRNAGSAEGVGSGLMDPPVSGPELNRQIHPAVGVMPFPEAGERALEVPDFLDEFLQAGRLPAHEPPGAQRRAVPLQLRVRGPSANSASFAHSSILPRVAVPERSDPARLHRTALSVGRTRVPRVDATDTGQPRMGSSPGRGSSPSPCLPCPWPTGAAARDVECAQASEPISERRRGPRGPRCPVAQPLERPLETRDAGGAKGGPRPYLG